MSQTVTRRIADADGGPDGLDQRTGEDQPERDDLAASRSWRA